MTEATSGNGMDPKEYRLIDGSCGFHYVGHPASLSKDFLWFASSRAQSVRVVTLPRSSLSRHSHEKRCVLSSSIGELSLCEGSSTAKFAGCGG